jgi:hypothetical protein
MALNTIPAASLVEVTTTNGGRAAGVLLIPFDGQAVTILLPTIYGRPQAEAVTIPTYRVRTVRTLL